MGLRKVSAGLVLIVTRRNARLTGVSCSGQLQFTADVEANFSCRHLCSIRRERLDVRYERTFEFTNPLRLISFRSPNLLAWIYDLRGDSSKCYPMLFDMDERARALNSQRETIESRIFRLFLLSVSVELAIRPFHCILPASNRLRSEKIHPSPCKRLASSPVIVTPAMKILY